MKPKYGLITLLTLIFVGYAVWLQYSEQTQYEQLLEDSLVFKEELKNCKSFQVKYFKKSYNIEQNNDIWKVTSPIQDQLSEAAINAVLKPIQMQKINEVKTNKAYSHFGLDNPIMSFNANCLGKNYKLKFSKQLGPSKIHYIGYDNKIFVGSSIWKSLLNLNISHLRDSYILPEMVHIRQIQYQLKNSNSPLDIFLKDKRWHSENLPNTSTQQVNKYLSGLKDLAAESFYSNFISKQLMQQTGLLNPALKLTIIYNDQFNQVKTWKLSMGISNDRYFITSSNRNPVFELSPKNAKNMLWSYNDFKSIEAGENVNNSKITN